MAVPLPSAPGDSCVQYDEAINGSRISIGTPKKYRSNKATVTNVMNGAIPYAGKSGNTIPKVVPLFSSLTTDRLAWCISAIHLAMDNPSPLPSTWLRDGSAR